MDGVPCGCVRDKLQLYKYNTKIIKELVGRGHLSIGSWTLWKKNNFKGQNT